MIYIAYWILFVVCITYYMSILRVHLILHMYDTFVYFSDINIQNIVLKHYDPNHTNVVKATDIENSTGEQKNLFILELSKYTNSKYINNNGIKTYLAILDGFRNISFSCNISGQYILLYAKLMYIKDFNLNNIRLIVDTVYVYSNNIFNTYYNTSINNLYIKYDTKIKTFINHQFYNIIFLDNISKYYNIKNNGTIICDSNNNILSFLLGKIPDIFVIDDGNIKDTSNMAFLRSFPCKKMIFGKNARMKTLGDNFSPYNNDKTRVIDFSAEFLLHVLKIDSFLYNTYGSKYAVIFRGRMKSINVIKTGAFSWWNRDENAWSKFSMFVLSEDIEWYRTEFGSIVPKLLEYNCIKPISEYRDEDFIV